MKWSDWKVHSLISRLWHLSWSEGYFGSILISLCNDKHSKIDQLLVYLRTINQTNIFVIQESFLFDVHSKLWLGKDWIFIMNYCVFKVSNFYCLPSKQKFLSGNILMTVTIWLHDRPVIVWLLPLKIFFAGIDLLLRTMLEIDIFWIMNIHSSFYWIVKVAVLIPHYVRDENNSI